MGEDDFAVVFLTFQVVPLSHHVISQLVVSAAV